MASVFVSLDKEKCTTDVECLGSFPTNGRRILIATVLVVRQVSGGCQEVGSDHVTYLHKTTLGIYMCALFPFLFLPLYRLVTLLCLWRAAPHDPALFLPSSNFATWAAIMAIGKPCAKIRVGGRVDGASRVEGVAMSATPDMGSFCVNCGTFYSLSNRLSASITRKSHYHDPPRLAPCRLKVDGTHEGLTRELNGLWPWPTG